MDPGRQFFCELKHGCIYERRMEECKHPDCSSCDSMCECLCDTCQANYETKWTEMVIQENLCDLCGVPKHRTIASLFKFQYIHFFQACASCVSGMNSCLAAANLCETCREPLVSGKCIKCICLETESCECRQCALKSDTLPQSDGGAR